ncbi:transposase [Galbibacter sp. PAP.153]|uniref:transposase n=1 Tax=Galbibacter sp. PAP.153 TaxID=3104623 RepID=UPI00300A0683
MPQSHQVSYKFWIWTVHSKLNAIGENKFDFYGHRRPPDGFIYYEEGNYWLCPQGKKVTFRKQKLEKGTLKDNYFTKRSDCKGCPIKQQCIGRSHEKRINITAYRKEYERNIARVNSPQGRYMKAKRQSTVEPVFGTLTQFMGLRKINTIGIKQANKCMQLAAIAYNLKKYLKFIQKHAKSGVGSLKCLVFFFKSPSKTYFMLF